MVDRDRGRPWTWSTMLLVDHDHGRPWSWSTMIVVDHYYGWPLLWSTMILVNHDHGRPWSWSTIIINLRSTMIMVDQQKSSRPTCFSKKKNCRFWANFAERPEICIETLSNSQESRDAVHFELKSGMWFFFSNFHDFLFFFCMTNFFLCPSVRPNFFRPSIRPKFFRPSELFPPARPKFFRPPVRRKKFVSLQGIVPKRPVSANGLISYCHL